MKGEGLKAPIAVTFVQKIELVPGVWEFCWRPEQRVEFTPGQYADFEVAVPDAGGKQTHIESRTFTLVSHPTERDLRFMMRFEKPGSLYKRALMALEPGAPAAMTEPIGFAVLPADIDKPLVFVAQGIGIASALSPLAEIGRQGGHASRDVSVWWARRPEERALLDDFAYKGLVGSRHDVVRPTWLTAVEVIRLAPQNALFYLSGTQYFVSAMGDGLHQSGVGSADIIFDYYEGYVEL